MLSSFIAAELALACSVSLGKFLAKHYIGEFAQAGIGGFLDFGKDTFKLHFPQFYACKVLAAVTRQSCLM